MAQHDSITTGSAQNWAAALSPEPVQAAMLYGARLTNRARLWLRFETRIDYNFEVHGIKESYRLLGSHMRKVELTRCKALADRQTVRHSHMFHVSIVVEARLLSPTKQKLGIWRHRPMASPVRSKHCSRRANFRHFESQHSFANTAQRTASCSPEFWNPLPRDLHDEKVRSARKSSR